MELSVKSARLTFISFVVLLTLLEIYAARLSYENYGWTAPLIILLCTPLNFVGVALYFNKHPILSLLFVVVLALAIVPRQLHLTKKLHLLREEALSITNYLYQQKLSTGKFPESLETYQFKYPTLKQSFWYRKSEENEFEIQFFVGTENASHFYSSRYGTQWHHIDD